MSNRSKLSLLDHLVGSGEQRWRHGDADRPRRLRVDHKLELARLHDGQIRRLGSFEDTPAVDAYLAHRIRQTRAVADQPADLRIVAQRIYCRDSVARRQMRQLETPAEEERAAGNEERIGALLHKCCENYIDLATAVGLQDLDL